MTYLELSTKSKPFLVLNGAEHLLQVLLADEEKIFFYHEMITPRQGMKFLPLSIKMALESSKIRTTDLKGIACVSGPGYFTGLRVVISVAMGISCSADIPVAPLNYLFLIAKGAAQKLKDEDSIWVLTYARKNMVNIQGFDKNLNPIIEPRCRYLEDCIKIIQKNSKKPALVGSGLREFYDFWTKNASNFVFLSPKFDSPLKEALWEEGLHAKYDLKPIVPLYLRPSDAEQNLEYIKSQRGL